MQPSPALDAPGLRALTAEDVPALHALECRACAHPWTPGHLLDSLRAQHPAWVLTDASAQPLAYCVAMPVLDEMHLLNIVVAPEQQGRGLARQLFQHLAWQCQQTQATTLWLEVREGNVRARRLYTAWGFEPVGLRKHYYPAADGQREHAVVMRWCVPPLAPGATP